MQILGLEIIGNGYNRKVSAILKNDQVTRKQVIDNKINYRDKNTIKDAVSETLKIKKSDIEIRY